MNLSQELKSLFSRRGVDGLKILAAASGVSLKKIISFKDAKDGETDGILSTLEKSAIEMLM